MFTLKFIDGSRVDSIYERRLTALVTGAAMATACISDDELESFVLEQKRRSNADRAFDDFLFGEGVTVVGQGDWANVNSSLWQRPVFTQREDSSARREVTFHVQFEYQDSKVTEAYAIVEATKTLIGFLPAEALAA